MTELIGHVDQSAMADWIASIPFEDWPQQHKLNGQIRPAMVTDRRWHNFGAQIDNLMRQFEGYNTFQHMLSVVMPGHDIPEHLDDQPFYWKFRVHVPLATNDESKFIVDGEEHQLIPGFSYRVNTRLLHSVVNRGLTPRIHFMFDVRT